MKSFQSIFPKAVLIASLLFSSGNFLLAQVQPAFTAVPVMENKIKFVGSEGDMLVFEVRLDNLPVKGSTLSILDEQNNILFEERIFAATHTCRYKIARNNMELITFKISGKTFSFNQSFTINYRVEEKLEVKKVK
jgi:hypothetical protein